MSTETSTSTPQTVTRTESVAAGGGGRKPIGLDIIVPGPISLYQKDKVIVPVQFRNNKDFALRNINIRPVSATKGIKAEFLKNFITLLNPGDSETINLELSSSGEFAESDITGFDVQIIADVTSPLFSDLANVLVNLIPRGGANRTIVVKQALFAADLFKENPECLELNELLDQAKESLEKEEYQKAFGLTEAAINGCRDLVTSAAKRIEQPIKEKRLLNLIVGTIITGAVLGIIFAVFLVLKGIEIRRKESIAKLYSINGHLQKAKKEKKGLFSFKFNFRKKKHHVKKSGGEEKKYKWD
jgi:hypothetical protein